MSNRADKANELMDTARGLMNEHCDRATLSIMSGIMSQMYDFTAHPMPFYCDECGVGLDEPITVERVVIGDYRIIRQELCFDCQQSQSNK